MIRFVLAVALALSIASPASADCISKSLNVLAVVQAGDVLSTNGPVLPNGLGGFLSQNSAAGCGQPGRPACAHIEGDSLAARSGCVKSLGTDAACALAVNVAVRELEYAATRNARDKSGICFVNYAAALFYAAVVLPNNARAIYDVQKRGAFVKNPALKVTFWKAAF